MYSFIHVLILDISGRDLYLCFMFALVAIVLYVYKCEFINIRYYLTFEYRKSYSYTFQCFVSNGNRELRITPSGSFLFLLFSSTVRSSFYFKSTLWRSVTYIHFKFLFQPNLICILLFLQLFYKNQMPYRINFNYFFSHRQNKWSRSSTGPTWTKLWKNFQMDFGLGLDVNSCVCCCLFVSTLTCICVAAFVVVYSSALSRAYV